MSHTTFDGPAVVVTGPAEADAVNVRHAPGANHSHDATPTSWGEPSGGAI
jgi:hypothetical protein